LILPYDRILHTWGGALPSWGPRAAAPLARIQGRAWLDGLLEKVIDDHRPRPRGGGGDGDVRDFVDVLLDVHKNDKEHGIQLETNEIKAIILVNY